MRIGTNYSSSKGTHPSELDPEDLQVEPGRVTVGQTDPKKEFEMSGTPEELDTLAEKLKQAAEAARAAKS